MCHIGRRNTVGESFLIFFSFSDSTEGLVGVSPALTLGDPEACDFTPPPLPVGPAGDRRDSRDRRNSRDRRARGPLPDPQTKNTVCL